MDNETTFRGAGFAARWTDVSRLVEPGLGVLGDGCELVLAHGPTNVVLAVVWLEADDQPWRWAIAGGSWLDIEDDMHSGEAATLHDAQAAAAAFVREQLVAVVGVLLAPAGQAVPS